jgi:putative phosphoribosyl transferase
MIFNDRTDAGKQLSKHLTKFKGKSDTIIIGLPRGGVVTAYEIAKNLSLPMDIIAPRKIGAPYNPELAVGAVTEDGSIILNNDIMASLDLKLSDIKATIDQEKHESERRINLYRKGRKDLDLKGKTVILVDDGIATGATMHAAVASAKARKAKTIIIAVPVASPQAIEQIRPLVDDIICLIATDQFFGISAFYKYFPQIEDEQVIELMNRPDIVG